MWESIQHQLLQDYQIEIDPELKTKIHATTQHQFYLVGTQQQQLLLTLIKHPLQHDIDIYCKQLGYLNQFLWQPELIGNGQLSAHHSYLVFRPIYEYQPDLTTACIQTFLKQLDEMHEHDESGMYGYAYDLETPFSSDKNHWQKNWATFFAEQKIGWQLQLHAEAGRKFISIDEFVSLIKQKLLNYQPLPSLIHGGLFDNYHLTFGNRLWFFQPSLCYGDPLLDTAALSLIPTFSSILKEWHIQREPPLRTVERYLIYQLYYALVISHENEAFQEEIPALMRQILAL